MQNDRATALFFKWKPVCTLAFVSTGNARNRKGNACTIQKKALQNNIFTHTHTHIQRQIKSKRTEMSIWENGLLVGCSQYIQYNYMYIYIFHFGRRPFVVRPKSKGATSAAWCPSRATKCVVVKNRSLIGQWRPN